MIELVLVRHGQSVWNLENKFTGWTDVDLSKNGIIEAKNAGLALKNGKYSFDMAYVSNLIRAQHTLDIILEELGEKDIPIHHSYKLNERHYGGLQGLNKDEARLEFGEAQVELWRRSYDIRPPEANKANPGEPNGESLKDTYIRVVEYYNDHILKELKAHKRILIVAHGNSLRALCKYLLNISDTDILDFEIPTGKPLIIVFDDNLKVTNHYYL